MKLNIEYLKRNKVMVGVIIVVMVLIMFLMLRGQSSGSGGGAITVAQASGPSEGEMQLAGMQMQVGMRSMEIQAALTQSQLEAGLAREVAQGQLSYAFAELEAGERVSDKATQAQLMSNEMQMQYTLQSMIAQNQFSVDYASLAYDNALDTMKLNADLQYSLGAMQLEGYKHSSELAAIGSLGKKDKAAALAGISGYQIQKNPNKSGGGLLGFIGGLAKIAAPFAGVPI